MLRRLGKRYEADQVEEIASLFEDLRLVDISVKSARRESFSKNSYRLEHDGSNIASYILRIRNEYADAYAAIEQDLKFVLPSFDEFVIEEYGDSERRVRILLKERNFEKPFSLEKASFGTVRAIVLFSMLHDPKPPRLTCIEEIDHGFHPQALDRLVDRLREAQERTQLIVATHSPALVNRLRPSELIMFGRDEQGASRAVRPDQKAVDRMSEVSGFGLGELWFSGILEDFFDG